MTDTSASLGPLNLFDGRWVVGDVRRPDGYWVEFRADGLYQHARDSEGQVIPWPRIMLGIGFTLGGKYPSRGSYSMWGMLGGLPGPWKGRFGGYLHMTLRHPYEDWVARFDRHPRWYPGAQLVLFEELLRQTGVADELHLLGDRVWLGSVVAQLAPRRPWTQRSLRDAVKRARKIAPPSAGEAAS
ncbi:hypothetical protein [Streptomyces sp. MMG1533]|uniref:hypothetical protein n=1 Tax=Streptomyces sp. MMG1533 TaxID=1415546 RepID=UPI000A5FAAB0|nr:hypothetical protein [Streptomyces sp. MMG1533]